MALGALVEAYMVSQTFATPDNRRCLIPVSTWTEHGLSEALLECNLASREGDQIYVRGALECHAWLIQKREAGAKGGRPKQKTGLSRKPKHNRSEPERTEANPLTLSLSPPLTLTPTQSPSGLQNAPAGPALPTDIVLNSEIRKSYTEAYFSRYGTQPVLDKIANSQIKKIGERLGKEAPAVVRFYVGHNKSFYVGCTHSIGICLKDAESLRTQWATGNKVTNREAQQADDGEALKAQLKRIRGSHEY